MARSYPITISRYDEWFGNMAFGPNGDWLVTSSINGPGTVRFWDLDGDSLPSCRVIREAGTYAFGVAALPGGDGVLLGKFRGVELLSVKTGETYELPDAHLGFVKRGLTVSRDGRYGAAGTFFDPTEGLMTVWDLESGETIETIGFHGDDVRAQPIYLDEKRLLSAGTDGLVVWNLDTLNHEQISGESAFTGVTDASGSTAALFISQPGHGLTPDGSVEIVDVESRTTTTLDTHGDLVTAVAMNSSGSIVATGDKNGVIRVGPTSGEEPQLLLGSGGYIHFLAIDPRGRWIASSDQENVLRLWPMPDLSKPPLHILPREELIAKLKTLTNLRVVRDPESSTGWTLTHDPFPGWETVPTW
jgi:WD40 repeat protein